MSVISTMAARKLIKKRHEAYLCYVTKDKKDKTRLGDILIVNVEF